MIAQKYIPDNPPGYVHVSNSGFKDITDNDHIFTSHDEVTSKLYEQFKDLIPLDAFITLSFEPDGPFDKNRLYQTGYATFVMNEYAHIVERWHNLIYKMLAELESSYNEHKN